MTLTVNVNHRLVGFGDDTPAALKILRRIEENQMTQQEKLDALTDQLNGFVADLSAAYDGIAGDIADIKAANPAVDLSKLEATVASFGGIVTKAKDLDAQNPPPVTP